MMHLGRREGFVAAAALLMALPSAAQTTVVVPDTSQTTTISVVVSEQARIAVPAGVAFGVTNVNAVTAAAPAAVTIDRIVLSSATQQLRLSLQANAAGFTPPDPGATTWSAGDVSWNAAAWTAATGAGGTLSNAAFTEVAACDAGASACSTTELMFSLAPAPAVQRAGAHTLIVTWKIESIGS
jgi:phosphotransferase system  glucose/maltose/N-acetylglucosamine-specific IIC component